MKKVLFIASTGGHLDELMQLKPIFQNYDYHIVTEKDKSTKILKKIYGTRISYLIHGTRRKILTYPFKFALNFFKTLAIHLKTKPKYIVATGAHTSVCSCYLGKLFGSKIIFIETFANIETRTLSGRMIYPISDLFIVQWENMLKLYPKAILGGAIY
ncbi:MAG: UDP-N-acetylglucosamine transferase subunit ALG14 [Oscillospiraceae bacterium]|nr:UDP-N-acetylglucosamine transferase subunit ALG14 [Oscillospiraceae bacterium]